MKKSNLIALIFAIMIIMTGCNRGSAPTVVTDTIDLSGEYDRVLAEGMDKSDNYYALVAKQEETYNGYKISVGVIKNNNWQIPLTEEFPFLNEKGLFVIPGYVGGTRECDLDGVAHDDFFYVQDGCFYSPGASVIYNAETQKYYQFNDWSRLSLLKSEVDSIIHTYDGKFAVQEVTDPRFTTCNICLFDLKTMTLMTLVADSEDYLMGAYYDGLVAIGEPYNQQVKYFYNDQGKKVIDLSEYNSDGAEKMHFENGEFRFYVTNDLGTRFELTIDKAGTLVDERKMYE